MDYGAVGQDYGKIVLFLLKSKRLQWVFSAAEVKFAYCAFRSLELKD